MITGEALLAYSAGIIDGEGTITLVGYKGRYKGQLSKSVKYQICIIVTHTDSNLVNFLKVNFGGVLTKLKIRPGCRQTWRWHISSRKAAKLLFDLKPYLLVKLPQAELALAFNVRRLSGIKGQNNNKRIVLDQADKILMLSLNKRENEEDSHGLRSISQ